jgi:DNA modification methylase
MASASDPGAMIYVVMSAKEWGTLRYAMEEAGCHWSSTIIWAKNTHVMSRKDYHTRYEPIWYGWFKNAKGLCHLTDRKQNDVWEIDRPQKSPDHPTTKPIALAGLAINNSSKHGDAVLDLFGGSGTTLLAAEQTGRTAYLMELDPKYADVIVKRYIKQQETDEGVFLLRGDMKMAYHEIPDPASTD